MLRILNFFHFEGILNKKSKIPMLHRDIKTLNIMILVDGDKFSVRFVDLGNAVQENESYLSQLVYSRGFTPKEIMNSGLDDRYFQKADDIWSLGVTIF